MPYEKPYRDLWIVSNFVNKTLKKKSGKHPAWVNNVVLRRHGLLNETLREGVRVLPVQYCQGDPRVLWNNMAYSIIIGYSLWQCSKTLLLKTPHTLAAGCRKINHKPMRKLPPWWLAFYWQKVLCKLLAENRQIVIHGSEPLLQAAVLTGQARYAHRGNRGSTAWLFSHSMWGLFHHREFHAWHWNPGQKPGLGESERSNLLLLFCLTAILPNCFLNIYVYTKNTWAFSPH